VSASALSFDDIHGRLRPFVVRTVAASGVRSPEVDDVAQEVFVLLHRKGGDFRDLRAARSWLYGAARRLASNHLRGMRRAEAREPGWAPGEGSDMDLRVDARSTLGRLERAAAHLDPAATSAFSMVQLEGRAPAEAAAALGLNVNTTRSHVQRVRARLRRVLTVALVLLATVSALMATTCEAESVVAEVQRDPVRGDTDAGTRAADAEHLRNSGRDRHPAGDAVVLALWSGAQRRSA
jgi:RNA polymerase sigma-70 factor (ECF subfamily)